MPNVPPGYYKAHSVSTPGEDGNHMARFGESEEKGTKFVLLVLEIDEGDYTGTQLQYRGYFTEKTYARTIESLRYLGFKGDDLAALDSQRMGEQVSITIEDEEYDGKTHSRIQWVNRLNSGGPSVKKPIEGTALRAFAAQMKSRVAAVKEEPSNGAPPPPAQTSWTPGTTPSSAEDEVPF